MSVFGWTGYKSNQGAIFLIERNKETPPQKKI
jgi:hypothetical protein